MRINHNIAAMNTYRQLNAGSTNASKSMEKLSSGLRINRAGDDAAGLAISEKMRGQIRGLDMASRNAQDGISLIQTAEGALNETHSILQRMRELAVQSANDTNKETDRGEIQKEINQLAEEVTRIAKNTEYNTQGLLDGSFKGKFHIGSNENQNIELSINKMDAETLGVAAAEGVGFEVTSAAATGANALNANTTFSVEKLDEALSLDDAATAGAVDYNYVLINDNTGNVEAVSTDGKEYLKLTTAEKLEDITPTDTVADVTNAGATFADPVVSGKVTSDAAGKVLTGTAAVKFASEDVGLASGTYKVVDNNYNGVANLGLVNSNNELVAIGDAAGKNWETIAGDSLFTTVTALTTVGTEITVSSEGGIDVSSQSAADKAITTIQDAIESVSAERSKLGAYQNRLEHTINNLGTSAENLTAAESRVRDVDMAKEMMEFTKNNILSQAAQAMLAQANQQPQGVLQLLR